MKSPLRDALLHVHELRFELNILRPSVHADDPRERSHTCKCMLRLPNLLNSCTRSPSLRPAIPNACRWRNKEVARHCCCTDSSMGSTGKTLVLFDVDGTLTLPRKVNGGGLR